MFIFAFGDFKELWKKYLLISIAVVCVLGTIIIALLVHGSKMPNTATCDQLGEYSLITNSSADDIVFLQQMGLYADESTLVSDQIRIPAEFNSYYEQYNELQEKIGLNLQNYKGVMAKRNTYKLKNYESDSKAYYVTLLIFENRVIGGHISSNIFGDEYISLG